MRAEVDGEPSYDVAKTGAADAVRETATAQQAARSATATPSARPARPARCRAWRAPRARSRAPSPRPRICAIAGYDELTAEEIIGKLAELSQVELAKVDAYERKHENRSTVLTRISALQGDEPWPGYDELTVDEIRAAVGDDDERASACAATSARTRTAPACSAPPSASSPAPRPGSRRPDEGRLGPLRPGNADGVVDVFKGRAEVPAAGNEEHPLHAICSAIGCRRRPLVSARQSGGPGVRHRPNGG